MILWYPSELISHRGEYLNYKHMDMLFVGLFGVLSNRIPNLSDFISIFPR